MTTEVDAGAINHLLLQLARQHFTRLHTLMESIGLHRGQPPLLHILWEMEGRTQSDLAAKLHVQPATVTKMLQRMEQAGFIERRADPDDQRVSRVYLTQAGHAIESAVCQRDRQVEEELLTGFTPKEKEQLAQFLIRMRDNMLQINLEALECEFCNASTEDPHP